MKKYAVVLTLILFAGMVTLVSSCGNSAEEEAARLQAIADSLQADSLAQATMLEDSLRLAYEDSVAAHMDSLQNALDDANRPKSSGTTKKSTPKEQPKVKNTTVETKKGGMTPKIQPKEQTLLDKKKGAEKEGGSLLDKKKGSVKEGGGLLKKKKGGNP